MSDPVSEPAAPAAKPKSPLGRKGGRIPVYAKNQTDLGQYLMPPRDRKMIQRAMKLEGCPGRTPDGRYHVGQWQEFINHHFSSHTPHGQPDKMRLEMEKLKLQNDKLRFELQVKQREYTANVDVERWVGGLVMQAKRVLCAIPSKLAPQLAGADVVECEALLKAEINSALQQLSSQPLHESVVPAAPAAPAAPEADTQSP